MPRLSNGSSPLTAVRIAVLVRTHLANDKLFDLLTILERGVGYDLFILGDETRGALPFRGKPMISHSASMCAEIGLLGSHVGTNLLWHLGDYAFYCAHHVIPDYDYYVMIEYDVDIVRGNTLALEGFINRLANATSGQYDMVAPLYGLRPSDWVHTLSCGNQFDKVYGIFFPFVALSKRALVFLYDWRCREVLNPPANGLFVFCEAFVPSALNAAGCFLCADLATLMPGSYDSSSFHSGRPMLLGSLPKLVKSIEFVHPVYSEVEFLERLLNDALRTNKIKDYIRLLSDSNEIQLTASVRENFLGQAQKHASRVPTVKSRESIDVSFSGKIDLGRDKPAIQSSYYPPWCTGPTEKNDARRANSGSLPDDFAFHTNTEKNPWWQVDLLEESEVELVEIVNRSNSEYRFKKFRVETSLDATEWFVNFTKMDDEPISSDPDRPALCWFSVPARVRYLRIVLLATTCLHLRRVRVCGTRINAHCSQGRQSIRT